MSKVQVRVEMEEGWVFQFQREGDPANIWKQPLTLKVDEQLVADFQDASIRYFQLKEQVEQLYRVQEGLHPFQQPEVPEHELLVVPGHVEDEL